MATKDKGSRPKSWDAADDKTRFEVLVGFNWPDDDRRVEAGEIVDELPPNAVKWMMRDGIVRIHDPEAAAEEDED